MKKREITIAIILAICLILCGSIFIYRHYIRVQNVFDQMYYTRMDLSWLTGTYFAREWYYSGMFSNMKQAESYTSEEWNIYSVAYRSYYLDPDTSLRLDFFPADEDKPSRFYIDYEINPYDDENRKWYSYKYDLSDRTLTYTSNDPDNTENKMFLYDIFLEDWFEANPGTRFSMDDLGEYTFIDETAEE